MRFIAPGVAAFPVALAPGHCVRREDLSGYPRVHRGCVPTTSGAPSSQLLLSFPFPQPFHTPVPVMPYLR